MSILKSIGAILAGMVFIVVTHTVTDLIMEAAGVFPPPDRGLHITWLVVLATFYRTIWSIAGCYLTAALAPSRPVLHAMLLGSIGFVVSGIAAIYVIPMDLGPAWYPIALTILSPICGWLGGMLYDRRHGRIDEGRAKQL